MNTQKASESVGKALPTDATVFKFPAGMRAILLGVALLCVALIASTVVMQLTKPERGSLLLVLLSAAVCGPGTALCIRSFSRFRDSVAVSSEGIWYLARSGKSIFIAWADVAEVKADDTMQRLILRSADGTRAIRAEYQLENFAALRDFVLAHAKELVHLNPSGISVFHRTWINKIVLTVFGVPLLLIAMQCYRQGVTDGFMATFLLGAYAVILIAFDPSSVRVGNEGVVIRYPLWKRTVPFEAITKIALKDESSRGNVWAAVVIETRQKRRISLFRFREGSIALNEALQSGWRACQANQVSDRA